MRTPKAILIAIVVIIAVGSIFAYRTAKWTFGRLRRVASVPVNAARISPSSSSPPIGDATTNDEAWRPSQVGAAMSEAFDTAKLPQPLGIEAIDPDAAAAELAEKVGLRDELSTSALLSAIKLAGFNIRGADGNTLVDKASSGQGIVFDSWEVASAAKLYGDGLYISLASFSDAFTESIPGFKTVPFSNLLIAGIRSDAESEKPALRFWARFIVALGKQADPAYDLLSPAVNPQTAQLDAVQFAFITKRLAADLAILGSKNAPHARAKSLPRSGTFSCSAQLRNADFRPSYPGPSLLDAVWRPANQPRYVPAAFQEGESGSSQLPCNLTEGEMQLLDAIAYSYGIGFDQLMELLSTPGILTEGGTAVVEGMSKFTLLANAVLVYFKLVFTSMTLHTTITMDSPPLVRNIYAGPGCRRKLQAQIVQKVGNWPIIHCLRTALNVAGLDVSLPTDGPVKETATNWHLVDGGVNVAEAASTGMNTAIVEFVCNGPRIQDAGTYAGVAGAGNGIAVGDCVQPYTDEEGKVEIGIEGTARRSSLQGLATPIMKTATVQLTFAAKPPNMKQDLIDTMAAGGLIGGNPAVLLSVVAVEMTLRSRWFASPVFTIPVKDWQACHGGWSGKLSFERRRHWSKTETSPDSYGGTLTTSSTSDEDWRQDWQLDGSQHSDPAGGIAADATWTALIKNRSVGIVRRTGETRCPPSYETMAGKDGGHVTVILGFMQETADTQTYFIGAALPSGPLKPDAVQFTAGGGCPGTENTGSKPIDVTDFSVSGTVSDSNHLSGIRRIVDPDGTDTIFKWDLHLCGQVGDVCGQQN